MRTSKGSSWLRSWAAENKLFTSPPPLSQGVLREQEGVALRTPLCHLTRPLTYWTFTCFWGDPWNQLAVEESADQVRHRYSCVSLLPSQLCGSLPPHSLPSPPPNTTLQPWVTCLCFHCPLSPLLLSQHCSFAPTHSPLTHSTVFATP